jgi:hypothetical protein
VFVKKKNRKSQQKARKVAKPSKMARKSSDEQAKLKPGQKLEISTKAQNQHSP